MSVYIDQLGGRVLLSVSMGGNYKAEIHVHSGYCSSVRAVVVAVVVVVVVVVAVAEVLGAV